MAMPPPDEFGIAILAGNWPFYTPVGIFPCFLEKPQTNAPVLTKGQKWTRKRFQPRKNTV